MKESFTSSGTQKSLLTTFALLVLAAGPARAQAPAPTPDDKPTVVPVVPADAPVSPAAPVAPPPPPAALAPTPSPPPSPEPPPPADKPAEQGVPHMTEVPIPQTAETSWFTRTPLKVSIGSGKQTWAFTLFGTIQADFITDTTRSYDDYIGRSLVARSDTYEGSEGRTQFSMRNTRVGFLLDAPAIGSVTPSAVFQLDFSGNQPALPYVPPGSPGESGISENAYYNSPTARIRHAYMVLRNPIVDVLAGHTFDVFGWQNAYMATFVLALPNQVLSRSTQFRLSHSFNAQGSVVLDLALAAARPAQRDSRVPDAMGGVRLSVPGWKGITTPGSAVTIAAPFSIGLSGVARQFYVNAFTPPPAQTSNSTFGWGVSADIFIPVIPAASAHDRGNKLTLLGSYVWGTGIGDLVVATGGARFPTLPNPAQASPPPHYTPDIDNGLVTFDTRGVLHAIDWWAAKGAFQYYLPGSGRIFLAGTFTYAHSRNIAMLYPRGGAEIELLGSVVDSSLGADSTLMFDATPNIRFGLSGQYTWVRYLDGNRPDNIRGIASALYTF